MNSDWNDHPAVVVLEAVVRQLVVSRCLEAAEPSAASRAWEAWLKAQGEQYQAAAFRDSTKPQAALVAIEIAGQFDTFAQEFVADLSAQTAG